MSDGPPRPSFSLRLISGKLPMKLESAVATVVIGAVFGVAWLVFNLPGPLVVHLNDDQKQPVQDARVRCTNEAGDKTFSGVTDVFGEAKWPGLARGMWSCEVWPPARFFSPSMKGAAVVVPRAPASVLLTVERSAQVAITIKRPQHAPYAAMAVRAVCPAERGLAVESWEERTSVLQPKVTLWL
ncbi:MAG: hypothetical protein JST92_18635, partial [Deltaproteobacteria bacterium]|nr:hypothetical protein [Deltaproteobacteria bacterium]